MDELRDVLDDLDEWFRSERPDLYPRLRPGLSRAEMRDLERRVAPYRLPEDLVVLYSWHDGWDEVAEGECIPFFQDMPFNSLGEAVEQYTLWCSLIPEFEPEVGIWHRLWFPAFLVQSGEFVELQSQPGQPAGLVWSFHSHDGLVNPTYASVAKLFETTLALWRRDLLPLTGPFFPDGFHAFVASLNPDTRQPDGRPRREVSRSPSPDWPPTWLA
jgi:cell wall assembly regulator SMI1